VAIGRKAATGREAGNGRVADARDRVFLLAFLCAILDLPEPPESGIGTDGKIETPQSTMIAKS
jgi:hypothetical protein